MTILPPLTPELIAEWIDEAWGNDRDCTYAHQNLAESVFKHLQERTGEIEPELVRLRHEIGLLLRVPQAVDFIGMYRSILATRDRLRADAEQLDFVLQCANEGMRQLAVERSRLVRVQRVIARVCRRVHGGPQWTEPCHEHQKIVKAFEVTWKDASDP